MSPVLAVAEPTRRLRVLAIPQTDPPRVHPAAPAPVARPAVQGTLALTLAVAAVAPVTDFAPRPTPQTGLPDPSATAGTLIQAVVEVLCGIRPATQMIRWMAYDVHTALARRAAVAARVRRQSRNARPPMVRAVRVFSPREGAVEASAVILDNDRVRAIAMRMEALDHRWRVTALEIG